MAATDTHSPYCVGRELSSQFNAVCVLNVISVCTRTKPLFQAAKKGYIESVKSTVHLLPKDLRFPCPKIDTTEIQKFDIMTREELEAATVEWMKKIFWGFFYPKEDTKNLLFDKDILETARKVWSAGFGKDPGRVLCTIPDHVLNDMLKRTVVQLDMSERLKHARYGFPHANNDGYILRVSIETIGKGLEDADPDMKELLQYLYHRVELASKLERLPPPYSP